MPTRGDDETSLVRLDERTRSLIEQIKTLDGRLNSFQTALGNHITRDELAHLLQEYPTMSETVHPDTFNTAIDKLGDKITESMEKLSLSFVSAEQFKSMAERLKFLERIVYCGLGFVLISVLGAMVALVIRTPHATP